MARLAHIVAVGPETSITLILARTCLQLHSNLTWSTSLWVRSLVAFGASSIQRSRAFEALLCTVRATLVDHIGEHIVWTVIDARSTLQEETTLTLLAFRDQRTIAFGTIRMTFDAHGELV